MSVRVLMVGCESFEVRPGGLNRYLSDLAASLEREGTVVQRLRPGNVAYASRLPGPVRLAARLAVTAVVAVVRVPRADVVDVHFALYGLPSVLLASALRKKVVVHFQGPWAEESLVAGKGSASTRALKLLVEKMVYTRADAVIVLSKAFGDRVTRDYGVEANRVHVLRPAVDHVRFRPQGSTVPTVPLTAVAARRLDPRMGLDVAVRAWQRVVAEFPSATLTIAGTGRERENLDRLVSVLGLQGSVELVGRVSDEELVDLYRGSHISLVPTKALEGFGLVALESFASGTPAIVSDVDALPEFVAELDPSLVVPPGDDEALATRVIAAFHGALPTSAECLAYADQYSWKKVAERHLALYKGGNTGTHRPSVTLLALEWPDQANGGGGVARLNWRMAHDFARLGADVTVVTLAGYRPSPDLTIRSVPAPHGRFDRFYGSPWRATRLARRVPGTTVVATGDDWPMWGHRRVRIFTGTARSEARASRGMRRVNHHVLALLEYATTLDPAVRAYSIGPDVPRSSMRYGDFPPVSGLQVSEEDAVASGGRSGIVFVGPYEGRKRGSLAIRVLDRFANDPALGLTVYTARAPDVGTWPDTARVVVGAEDTEVRVALEHALFLLSPSTYEGFGIPIAEALAAGCVPLAAHNAGAEAILEGPLAALLGPSDGCSYVDFAERSVRELMADPTRRQALQAAGRSRAATLITQADVRRLVKL